MAYSFKIFRRGGIAQDNTQQDNTVRRAGGIIVLIFVSCIVSLSACRDKPENRFVPQDTIPQTVTPAKILALGDSYTIGQGVNGSDRFMAHAARMLIDSGYSIGQVRYIAATGWTTLSLENAIQSQQPQNQGPWDIVTLLIGVNDQYQYRDTTGYRLRFRGLLQTAVALAGQDRAGVFVVSIPDYSVTPFARSLDTARVRQQLDWFNQINQEVSAQENVSYTYITDLTREARFNPALLCPDSLHPSGLDYARWAARLYPKIKTQLN